MARLIDADKLLMNVVPVSNSKGQVTWSAVSTIDILTAPTVDAVEVVRCKDCIRRYDTDECPMCYLSGGQYVEDTSDDSYCSRGAKMDGGENGE